MSQSSDHTADREFFRTFAVVITGLALSGIAFGIIAVVFTSQGYTIGKSRHFMLMTDQPHVGRLQPPVDQTNIAAEPSTQTVVVTSGSLSNGCSDEQVRLVYRGVLPPA